MFMVIEMEILKRKSMEQLIDELGPNDINFMKDLLKDLAKLDLFERVELDKEDDLAGVPSRWERRAGARSPCRTACRSYEARFRDT